MTPAATSNEANQRETLHQNNHENTDNNNNNNNKAPEEHPSSPAKSKQALFPIMHQLFSLFKTVTSGTIQTSTKVLTPAIANIIQTLIPILSQLMQLLTPSRIQHWVNILHIFYSNSFRLILDSAQGQTLIANSHATLEQFMNLITNVNTRQWVVDIMTFNIKCLALLQSKEMKDVLSSIPVLLIRFIDVLSSGEMKLFYHSIYKLSSNLIEFLNQDDMIVAIAEITARVVHALEMEHDFYLPSSKLQRRQRRKVQHHHDRHHKQPQKKRVVVMGGKRMNSILTKKNRNAHNNYARRRYERNLYMKQTYNDRILLQENESYHHHHRHYDDDEGDDNVDNIDNVDNVDNEHHIGPVPFNQDRHLEDAILSSLSPDHTLSIFSEDAWLTRLGRGFNSSDQNNKNRNDTPTTDKRQNMDDNNDGDYDDIPSLPSKVILKNHNQHQQGATQFSVDSSLHLDDLDDDIHTLDHDNETNDYIAIVDTSYLRSGIEDKKSRNDDNKVIQMMNLTDDNGDEERKDIHDSPNPNISNEFLCHDIEDLVLNDESDDKSEVIEQSKAKHKETAVMKKKKRGHINLSKDDDEYLNDSRNYLVETGNNALKENNRTKNIKNKNSRIRGGENTLAQFYETLEDIATQIRNQDVSKVLEKSEAEMKNSERNSDVKKRGLKWYPKAATAVGAGNESGQDIIHNFTNGSKKRPTRFVADLIGVGVNHDNITDEVSKSGWKQIIHLLWTKLTFKQKSVLIMIVLVYAIFTAILLAFGSYGIYKWCISGRVATLSPVTVPNEYVIRIVHDEIPKEAFIRTVTKAIENTAKAGQTNFVESVVASLYSEEL
jgi:hypothetical protein